MSVNDFSMPTITYLPCPNSLLNMLILSPIPSFLYSNICLLSIYYMIGTTLDTRDMTVK